MRDALGRLPFRVVVPVVVAGTLFAFACGSSSVAAVNHAGKPLRWAMLAALFVLAAAWAVERRDRALPSFAVLVSALFFLGLALVSTRWSVDPRLSAGRAVSLGILFAAAALLGAAAAGRAEATESVLLGLLGGATAVALAGLLLLAVDRGDAVESATLDLPWRYQGLGENPNTASLLFGLALPIAVWFAVRATSAARRALLLGVVVLLDGSIVASGSRGAIAAGFVGVAVVVALLPVPLRRRAMLAVVTAVALGASIGLAVVPKPNASARPPAPSAGSTARPPAPGYVNAEADFPLDFEIGNRIPGVSTSQPRSFLGSSGRSIAWRGALDVADERPALGYGFGTESKVFVDRYALFTGGTPENSYIGLDLQLGAFGLAAFLTLAAAIVVAAAKGLRRADPAIVGIAVFAGGLVIALVQSYIYSVGNIGTATVWICGFLAAASMARREITP